MTKIKLPDEKSGDCGDDFSPLDITEAGESWYKAYAVAKKTWQITCACDEVRHVGQNDSLSYLLSDDDPTRDLDLQYSGEVQHMHFDDLQTALAYTATQKYKHVDIVELFGGARRWASSSACAAGSTSTSLRATTYG